MKQETSLPATGERADDGAAPVPFSLRWHRVRIGITVLLTLGAFALVGRRAYRLQVEETGRLRGMAEQQYLKEIELPPRRGTILDRHGAPLAVSVDVDSIYANPRMVGEQAPVVAKKLAELLELPTSTVATQLASPRFFAWIKRRVPPQVAKRVREAKLRGVFLTQESRRYYPNHGLGSTVVGFAGADARGLEGVELAYDAWLRGSRLRVAGLRDALGRRVFSEGTTEQSTGGHDVVLTLDKLIQFETERALAVAVKDVRPNTGWVAAVVMDPATGDLLAMSSMPSYDPNRYAQAKPGERRNRTVADAFEPGSTMKAFSLTSVVQAGLTREEERIHCENGRYRVGRYTIHDAHPHGILSMAEVFQKSSNIGTAKLAFRLGKQRLYDALKGFGFGERTGLDLPGERVGILRPPTRWANITLTNVAFGQGVTTTMLHLARALSALGNDGKLMRPRLVTRIRHGKGHTVREFPVEGRQILAPAVAQRMRRIMVGVTEKGGTGTDAALERYTVAGKTGTAQKVDPVTGTYSSDRWVSSFMGLVPASRPRLAIVVVINEPAGVKHYGGEVAGPVFKQIAQQALHYLGVQPDTDAAGAKKDRSKDPAKQKPTAKEAPTPEGPAEEESDSPEGAAEGPQVTVPDFTGLSLAETIRLARQSGLRLEVRGGGRATAQSPGPGPAPRQTVCRVSFRPPG